MNTLGWKFSGGLIALLFSLVSVSTSWAEDIDLFTSVPPGSAGGVPTVMLVWDTASRNNASANKTCVYSDTGVASNLGSQGNQTKQNVLGAQQCAIANALLAIKSDSNLLGRLKVGLMVNTGTSCAEAIIKPTLMDKEGIEKAVKRIKEITSGELGTGQVRLADSLNEAWALINNRKPPFTCSGRDYSGGADEPQQCRDSYIIFIGNAFTNSNPRDSGNDFDRLKKELTENYGYATNSTEYANFTSNVPVTGSFSGSSYRMPHWARFMKRVNVTDNSKYSDHNVATYTVATYGGDGQGQSAGKNQDALNYYAATAQVGGGKAFEASLDDISVLTSALLDIFNEVQAVNSVFASASLPVSANTQGTFLNQVYIAMFRPDANAAPRWLGNVKQYRLGFDVGGNLVLTDAKPSNDPDAGPVVSVTNPATGNLAPNAVSFWSTNDPGVTGWPVNDGFWREARPDEPFDAPDGDLVEKGGAGQMNRADYLKSAAARKLLTCNAVGDCPVNDDLKLLSASNTTLMSNANGLFGLLPTTNNVPVQAGEASGSQAITLTNCQLTQGNQVDSRSCRVTHNGTPALVEGDSVRMPSIGGNCAATSCAISNVTANSFRAIVGNVTSVDNPPSTQIIRRTSTARISLAAHGFLSGEQALLSSCTANTAGLPTGAQGQQFLVTNVGGSNNFTIASSEMSTSTFNCRVESPITAGKLISWIRGEDVAGNEVFPGPCPLQADGSRQCDITVRPSIHGDVIHSRPAIVNYGDDVVIFYGANDGVFRAINGNQTRAIGDVRPGGELWGFVAPEFFPKFKRQYANTPLVSIPGIIDANAVSKDYFFDGSPTVLQDTRSVAPPDTAGKAMIFVTARRGGRMVYALDVSLPSQPRYVWSLNDSHIPELGQTWSQPRVALLAGYKEMVGDTAVARPVLIMGAGYDPLEDQDPGPGATGGSNTKGRGVVILDAANGKIVWAALASCAGINAANMVAGGQCVENAGLNRAIAADITLLDRSGDGFMDRLYAADVGANIWRIDVTGNIADFSIRKLAELGGTGNNARKFLFPPDVVPATSQYDLVLAVSGDREHPLATDSDEEGLAFNVDNRFYAIKDRLNDVTVITEDMLVDISTCADDEETVCNVSSLDWGYYLTFGKGEKGVNAPVSVAGRTFFSTNQPDVGEESDNASCGVNLGIARAYQVNFRDGAFTTQIFSGGGMPPSPIAGLVTIGGQTIPFMIGGSGPTPFDPGIPEIDLEGGRERTYWYFE